MGLLQVGAGAVSGVLADQWREYFYCPSMEADVLVKKGATIPREATILFPTVPSLRSMKASV